MIRKAGERVVSMALTRRKSAVEKWIDLTTAVMALMPRGSSC